MINAIETKIDRPIRGGLLCAMLACAAGTASADHLAFDYSKRDLSFNVRPGASVYPSDRWIGQAINLDPASPSLTITGFDVPVAHINASATPISAANIRLRVRIYDSHTAGGSPVFGSLLSDQTITSPLGTVPGSNQYLPYTSFPQFALPTPVSVTGLTSVGVAMIFEVNHGAGWVVDPFVPVLGVASYAAPTVGSTDMPVPSGLYMRHLAAGAPFGNFNPSDMITFTSHTHAGIDMRVYVAIPAPGAAAMLGLAGTVAPRRRR